MIGKITTGDKVYDKEYGLYGFVKDMIGKDGVRIKYSDGAVESVLINERIKPVYRARGHMLYSYAGEKELTPFHSSV